jgi:hypothetical protein
MGIFIRPFVIFRDYIKCCLGIHAVDKESVTYNKHSYFGTCRICKRLLRRKGKKDWQHWPSTSPDNRAAAIAYRDKRATKELHSVEGALARKAKRHQTVAKLRSIDTPQAGEGK